VHLPSEGK